jgi:acyl carrier protein
LDPGLGLRKALEIDSFDFLNVLVAVHETFGVTVPEADYRRVSTLDALTDYVADALTRARKPEA